MPVGPGKYDDLCTHVREQAHAQGCVVIIFGGDKGDGFSCQAPLEITLDIPMVLRRVAKQIEEGGSMLAGGSPP